MLHLHVSSILIGVVVDKMAAIVSIGLLLYLLGADSRLFQAAALFLGTSCTIVGGFVAARHAGARFGAHGGAVGISGLAISFGRFALTPSGSSAGHTLSWEIAAWGSVVAAGFLGGAIAARTVRRDENDRIPDPS